MGSDFNICYYCVRSSQTEKCAVRLCKENNYMDFVGKDAHQERLSSQDHEISKCFESIAEIKRDIAEFRELFESRYLRMESSVNELSAFRNMHMVRG